MKKDWKKLRENVAFSDNILRVRHEEYFYEPVSAAMTYTVVDISDWAVIVPQTEDGDFIIVKQFRAGNGEDTLEFPGGGINDNEEPLTAALRELREETGAEAGEMIFLGMMEPNPAFMSNKCYVFLARDSRRVLPRTPDKFEDTEALAVSREELIRLVKNGLFRQSISLAAYGLFLNNGG